MFLNLHSVCLVDRYISILVAYCFNSVGFIFHLCNVYEKGQCGPFKIPFFFFKLKLLSLLIL